MNTYHNQREQTRDATRSLPSAPVVPRGFLGPAGTQTRPRRKVGTQRPPGPPPRESGPWSLRSAIGLTSRRHELQVVWICQSDPERQIAPTPRHRGAISLNSERSHLRGQLWAAGLVSGLGTEGHVPTHSLHKQTSHPKASGRGNVLSGGKMPNTARV